MDVGLVIAGIISVALAVGHTTIGVVWVLPRLTEERVPKTPFGAASMTVAMIRVTWFIVTIFALASGALLILLASDPASESKTLVLRSFTVMWLAATAMAIWVSALSAGNLRGFPRRFLRLPVPLLWVVVAVLCWGASS